MKDLIVTPLGTVSPFCHENKNCPGFLVECGDKRVLLDCGSGCSRYFDMENKLNNLYIIISHLHLDHYSGLGDFAYGSLVNNNLGFLKDRVKVFVPSGDLDEKAKKPIMDFQYLMNYSQENYLDFIKYDGEEKIVHGDMTITFSLNPHPLKTYSIKITNGDFKVVYSADTGFQNNSLEQFAKDADLLICESTYFKELDKNSDSHLYAYEAATIAKKANVKKLMLTHFYPTVDKEIYVNEAKEIFENTIAAEEGKKLVLKKE